MNRIESISQFIKAHPILSVLTLGLAILGFAFRGKVYAWIKQCYGTAKKIDNVSKETIVKTRTRSDSSPRLPAKESTQPNSTPRIPVRPTPTVDERRYPPLSGFVDTIRIDANGKMQGVHGTANLFSKDEIVEIHPIVESRLLGNGNFLTEPAYIDFTKSQAAVIQQQAVRGCTAAASAMLIVQAGKKCDISRMLGRSLASTKEICQDIQDAGLKPIVTVLSQDLEQLKKLLTNGPAIISIGGELGGHVVVVDQVEDNIVKLRDPYHGWKITVKRDALAKRYGGGDAIQVERSN